MTTSIFYVNSMGFMAQWQGTIIAKTETTVTIRFSKNKAFRYNLKDLDIDFLLVTKTKVKDLGVDITKTSSAFSFDERLKKIVLANTKGNVQDLWINGKWETAA